MKLLETFVEISAKDDALRLGIKNARGYARREVGEMQRMMNSLAFPKLNIAGLVAGAAGLYGLKYAIDSLIGSTVTLGDTYHEMSGRTGIAVETLSALGYVAKVTGTEIDAYEKSLRHLANNMIDVQRAGGKGGVSQTFREMGIAVTGAGGALRPVMDVMMDAANVIARMTDETKQVAYVSDLFGARMGTKLLPALKMGAPALRAMIEEAHRLGIVMSTEDATAADAFNDQLISLTGAIDGMKRVITVGILPVLTEWVKRITEWVVQNRELVRSRVSEWLNMIKDALSALWKHKDTIANIFKTALIVIIAEKLLILAGVITKVTEALVALGMAKGWQATMKILSGSAIGIALSTLASPAGLAVLGTLAAGGAIAVGVGLVKDHLKEIDRLKFAGASKFVSDMKEFASAEEAIAAAKPKKITAPEMEKAGGMAMTLRGLVPAVEIPVPEVTGPTAEELKRIRDQFRQPFLMTLPSPPKIEYPKPQLGIYTPERRRIQEEFNAAQIKLDEETGNKIIAFQKENRDLSIRLTTEGYEQEKVLEITRFTDEIDSYNGQFELIELANTKHSMNMIAIDKNMNEQMLRSIANFAVYWADMLESVVQQSGNSFDNIVQMFEQMIKKMLIRAAVAGTIGFIFGGPTGAKAAISASLGIPGLQSGGEAERGKPYWVGEHGTELFVPRVSGTVVPREKITMGKTVNDNSRWELHFHDTAQERMAMVGLDDAEFSRKFKRCVRDGRITVKKTA